MKKFFGLLTDFGFDFAVASIKGVLFQAFPDAQIIDIDHTIEKFNVLNAAFVIEKIDQFLPQGTVLICVVDPGVGSEREVLYIETSSCRYIGPNNGIFHFLFDKDDIKVFAINPSLFAPKAITFHGRDLFAPAAIAIENGDRSSLSSIDANKIVRLTNLGDQTTSGVVTYIDSFGNAKTNLIVQDTLQRGVCIELLIDEKPCKILYVNTFANVKVGELLCYKGSNGTLEIAQNLGSAQKMLSIRVGSKIVRTS